MFSLLAFTLRNLLKWLSVYLLLSLSFAAQATPEGNAEKGKKLYEHGIDHNDQPVKALGQSGIEFKGEEATCLRCHRRSGFGGSEGGYYVPPISANFIYEPSRRDRNDRFRAAFLEAQNIQHWVRVRMPRVRPAYTTATLATALREGNNPSGIELDKLMPRYQLDDQDVANLAAYLATLSKEISPGVDEEYLHIATVIGPNVDAVEREAMLKTMQAYVKWYNERLYSDIAHESSARVYGMDVRSSTRLWKLHVWELDDQPKTWRAQLEQFQQQQPIFAMVNGLINGSWSPIAGFCDDRQIPCLFPLTELPENRQEQGGYNFYYTRGLELEADILGKYLKKMPDRPSILVQLHDGSQYGLAPAARLKYQLSEQIPDVDIQIRKFDDQKNLTSIIKQLSANSNSNLGIVIWGNPENDAILSALNQSDFQDQILFIPAHLIRKQMVHSRADLTDSLPANLHITWPFSLPQSYQADAFRVRGWMRSRSLPIINERIQLLSYYGMNVLRDSSRHLFEHFHQDYLVERIEHEVESSPHPGIYPTFSLGPEQRVMSKGGYVLMPDENQKNKLKIAADWIVP